MNNDVTKTTERFGLVANGSSERWYVAVDQSLERDAWLLEIDGRQVYLVFDLQHPDLLGEALKFLQTSPQAGTCENRGEIVLGRFGSSPVSLVRDNEDLNSCFLIVGPTAGSVLRVSFDETDIGMLIDALGQVVEDLRGAHATS
jgi:hypothetical protein